MRFRFTLTHLITFPTFSQWEAESGSWTIDDTPSVTIPSPTNVSLVVDYPLIPGTYELAYSVTVTGTGTWFVNFRFEKDAGATLLQEVSTGDSSPGTKTGTLQFTLTDTSTSIQIQFVNFSGASKTLTINSVTPSMEGVKISEPDGWKGAKIILEREEEHGFCSLVKRYQGAAGGAFNFYGDNGQETGGIELLKDIDEAYSFDADIGFLSEYAPDDVNYQEIFDGLLDMSLKNEEKDNRMQVPVIRDDFWAKFISRMNTPVNMSDLVDLDGNTVDPVTPVTVNLKSQKIRYNGEYRWEETVQYPIPGGDGNIQIDWDKTITDDINKFNLPRVDVSPTPLNLIAGLFEAPYDGLYTFDIRIESGSFFGGSWQNAFAEPRFHIGNTGAGVNEADYRSFTSSSTDNGSGQYLWVHLFTGSFLLAKGQQISLFGVTDSTAGNTNIFGERLNDWKTDVEVASTIALTLSGTQTIDNYAAGVGDRVLVKDQGDQKDNGVWVVAAGAWTRATDADSNTELQDCTVFIINGDTNGSTYWIQATEDVDLGVTPITFKTTIYNDTKLVDYPGTGTPDNHIIVTADTTFQESTAQGYLIHDLFHGVLARLGLGINPFYSEFLGSTLTNSRVYGADGCGWMYAIVKGLQVRGYTLTEKPFFISFKQIWDGINPILNLGLSYDIVASQQVIVIDQKEVFYDDSVSVNFSNVREISATYDQEKIYKTIKVGYKKWESEDISGIDDPQTRRTYATRLKKTGKEISLESDFIAAGLAAETARRTVKEKTTDYKYDNDNFIFALNETPVSADVYNPELDENFDTITNLINSDSRYNLILTPARNMLRWANVLGGCLQSYTTSSYKFVSGEGNYTMTSDYSCASGNECQAIICDPLGENQDISLATYNAGLGYLHLPLIFDITIPMGLDEFQEIDANRNKSIGISQTTTGHIPFKIKLLEYDIVKGEATIKAWPKTYFRIEVINQYNMSVCD